MKVLHVIPSVSPARGGPSFALALMAEGLSRAGVEIDVVTTDDDGRGRYAVLPSVTRSTDGYRITYHPRQSHFYSVSLPLLRWLALHVSKYDVVHIHALFSFPSGAAALFAGRQGIPYVIRPLGTLNVWGMRHRRRWIKRASYLAIERPILRGAAAIHFTSEKERSEALAIGITGSSVVIPLGVDLTGYDDLPARNCLYEYFPELANSRIILFLSRLDAIKGLDLLLPAFQRVHALLPDTKLVLAGSGEQGFVQELQNTANKLDLAQSIVWTGFLSGERKLAALSAASIFVLPSRSENFSVATAEALACGLPVVVSEHVGLAHEINEAGAGLVISNDVDALAGAIIQLLSDAGLRKRVGANALSLARGRLSSEATTPQLIRMYEQAILTRQISAPA